MNRPPTRVFGADLDHTIVDYRGVLPLLAREMGEGPALARLGVEPGKTALRDSIRREPDGEVRWQRIQSRLYGPDMHRARPFPGVLDAFLRLREQGFVVHVVSHKTHFPRREPRTDLRATALAWLEENGFFDAEIGLAPDRVHFADSRDEKVRTIARLACELFVDDLVETFREPAFPHDATRAVLFDPHGDPKLEDAASTADAALRHAALQHWDDCFPHGPATLVRQLGTEVRWAHRLAGGGNSRVYRLDLADDTRAVAKLYADRGPNRLDPQQVEATALTFLGRHQVSGVPRLRALDGEGRWSLLSWLGGEAVPIDEVELDHVDALLGFLSRLDGLGAQAGAADLPDASEASFSLLDLRRDIERRLERLRAADESNDDVAAQMRSFLDDTVVPELDRRYGQARQRFAAQGLTGSDPLPAEHRRLSPSDLGFHNALRDGEDGGGGSSGGQWSFLDFEYFGWDDPAKTLCDLLLHPRMRMAEPLQRHLVAERLAALAGDPSLPCRVRAGYPLFALKWTLILLNEFAPRELDRRRLARPESARSDPRPGQLAKARDLLARPVPDFLP